MKKLISVVTAIALILAITPTAFAAVYTEGYFHYTIADESITITGYFGDEETVTVPAMIAGIPVNTIASGAFTGSGIKTINLPDTITSIESGAIDLGVVINYNSNLPSGGQEQPQPNPPQPDLPQPNPPQTNMPGFVVNPISPPPQNNAEDDETPADDITVSEDEIPDDITVTEPANKDEAETAKPGLDEKQTAKSNQSEPQSTKSAQTEESKPQQSQTNQPEQPVVTTSTVSQNAIEEVEIELDLDKAEEVTTTPEQDIPNPTEETEAAFKPDAKPEESAEPRQYTTVVVVMVVAVAAVSLGGFIVWKKKKFKG